MCMSPGEYRPLLADTEEARTLLLMIWHNEGGKRRGRDILPGLSRHVGDGLQLATTFRPRDERGLSPPSR